MITGDDQLHLDDLEPSSHVCGVVDDDRAYVDHASPSSAAASTPTPPTVELVA